MKSKFQIPPTPLFQRGVLPHQLLLSPFAFYHFASPFESNTQIPPFEKGGLGGICCWNDGVAV